MKRLAAALALLAAAPAFAQQSDPKPGSISMTSSGFSLPAGGASAPTAIR